MQLVDAIGLALIIGGVTTIVILMRKDRPGAPKDGPW